MPSIFIYFDNKIIQTRQHLCIVIIKQEKMKNKNLYLVVLIISAVFAGCANDVTTDGSGGQEIDFSIGFVENTSAVSYDISTAGSTKITTDDSFRTTFEAGDAIGVFVYRRNADEASSIDVNDLYIDNRKMTYNGSAWQPESPIYYIDDETLLDIYAYFPYKANATAEALSYDAETEVADLLAASAMGAKKTDRQKVSLLFSHLLSMIQISVDRSDAIPYFDEAFSVSFHGVTSGVYNLETMSVSNTGSGSANMLFYGINDAERRNGRIWVPSQYIESGVVFSFFQSGKGNEIFLTTEFASPDTFVQGEAYQYHITLDTYIERDDIYELYEPYPKLGNYVGMVIEIYNGGKSGKVISLVDLEDSQWATENYWVGCSDGWDGISNKMKVQSEKNWQEKFPAFYQCSLRGERWYIPALEEAYPYLATNVRTINHYLLNIDGGQAIDLYRSYFMSTERSQTMVAKIYPNNGATDDMPKSDVGKIRAFYEF